MIVAVNPVAGLLGVRQRTYAFRAMPVRLHWV
jgi:hypothetical protein